MPTYPLYSDPHADLHTASGRVLGEVTVAATVAGEITLDDLQIDKAALQAQAEIARWCHEPKSSTCISNCGRGDRRMQS